MYLPYPGKCKSVKVKSAVLFVQEWISSHYPVSGTFLIRDILVGAFKRNAWEISYGALGGFQWVDGQHVDQLVWLFCYNFFIKSNNNLKIAQKYLIKRVI